MTLTEVTMPKLSRALIALSLVILASASSFAQLPHVFVTEVRGVEADRIILPGGKELPVHIEEDETYGPGLDNYPMLLRVGYVDLARVHLARGVVVKVEVLEMYQ